VDPRLLPEALAAQAVNSWLFSGRIEPLHSLVPIHTLENQSARSVFRLPIGQSGIDYMVDSYWLEFENENIRVIRSPIVGQDDDGRYYWADGIYPKYLTGTQIKQINAPMTGPWNAATDYGLNQAVTNAGITYVSIQTGINHPPATSPTFWVVMPKPARLGVPAPSVPPGVTATGGVSTINKTVNYVYTWVTDLGEEGPPSHPTAITNKLDAVYHVTMTAPSGTDAADRHLTKTRIYRTVVSAQGVATFFFVAEQVITDLTYDDDCAVTTDAVIVNNEQLMTVDWSEPPEDLQGLVTMPNGMVVGWRKNEVWFCEPYYPHAWPVRYIIGVDATIKGLGVYNQSVIILTEGQPYAATGILPEAMALSKIQPLEPCTARLSIVNTPNGVLYSSPNGLINITPAGAVNLTLQMILKDQWAKMVNLDSVMATIVSQGYYCYSGPTVGVFQEDSFQNEVTTPGEGAFQIESHYGTRPGVYISLNDPRLGVTSLDPTPSEVLNVIQDIFNGETMLVRDGIVFLVDLRKLAPYAKYRWRSKIFTLPYLQNMGAAKVYWTPADPSITEPSWFRVYADAKASDLDAGLTLRFQQKMTKSGQMFRLPSGYKAQYYQFEVEGYLNIDAIHCAQTAHELRSI
jgi:hypothetical protein